MKNSSIDHVRDLIAIHGKIETRTDPAIAAGIRRVHDWLLENPSGSLGSKKFPLLTILREAIDPSFEEFATRIGLGGFCYSEQLAERRIDIIDLFKISYRFLLFSKNEDREITAYLRLDQEFPGFKVTIDSLVWLSYLCCAMDGPTEKIVIAQRHPTGVKFDIQISKKRSRHISRRQANTPVHRYFDSSGLHLCELCSNMTEHARESIEVLTWAASQPAIAAEAIGALDNGARLSLPQFSATHCKLHSSQQKSSAAYRQGLRKLEQYHAMRAFLIIVRQISKCGINILADRAVSFAFVDECPERALIRNIPKLVDKFKGESYHVAEENPWAEEMLSHMEKMRMAFEKKNHPYQLIAKEYRSNTSDIYSHALELGIIPSDVDQNLHVVWPCMYRMLATGRAVVY